MRRCLLIAAFLLLTAPAAAVADGVVTTKLSSTPDSVKTGKPWKVTLTIHQQGRAPRSDLSPSIQIRDADGFTSTFPATPTQRAGRYRATVRFSKAGQYTYVVRDGLSHTTPAGHSVVIKDPAPVVNRPDPVGPRGLPIALAGLLALAAGGYALLRRHRQRVTGPLHPA
jgi:YtkA-like